MFVRKNQIIVDDKVTITLARDTRPLGADEAKMRRRKERLNFDVAVQRDDGSASVASRFIWLTCVK